MACTAVALPSAARKAVTLRMFFMFSIAVSILLG
jgi:hypothetical protein